MTGLIDFLVRIRRAWECFSLGFSCLFSLWCWCVGGLRVDSVVVRGVVLVVMLLTLLLVGLLVVWLYFSGRVSGRSSPL